MVPVVAHPLGVFSNHLGCIEVDLVLGAVPVVTRPDKVLILDQQACFVRDIKPLVRHWANTETKTIPMHLLGNRHQQFAHPLLIPGQGPGFRIFEKPMQGNIGSTHEIHATIQVGAFRRSIEPKLAHSKTCTRTVCPGACL